MVVANKIAPWPRKDPVASFDVKLMALVTGNITMQMGTRRPISISASWCRT